MVKFYCLGEEPNAACYIVKLKNTTIMLDCGLELASILSFTTRNEVTTNPPTKKRKQDGEGLVFVQNGPHLYIDSEVKYHTPRLNMVDLSSVDVILISNYYNMLALPYLTEYYGFNGRIFATEPTGYIGRQIMTELVIYMERLDNSDLQQRGNKRWQTEGLLDGLSHELKNQIPNALDWKSLYSIHDVESSISKIKLVSYDEVINIYDDLTLIPCNSGFCIGSVNWVIKTHYEKISYIAKSNIGHPRFCLPLNKEPLMNSDLVILTDVIERAPEPDNIINDICNQIGMSINQGGNVLIPCFPSGSVFYLFECIEQYLSHIGQSQTKIYFVSPSSETLLAYSNIIPEWLCKEKQEKSYIPEPPFNHATYLERGKLLRFDSTHTGEFSNHLSEPCIVFGGHPSLRCGDMLDLLALWKHDPKNTMIVIEPDFTIGKLVSVHEPLQMNILSMPLDRRIRMNSPSFKRWIVNLNAKNILVSDSNYQRLNKILPEENFIMYLPLQPKFITLERVYEHCLVTSRLAQRINPINLEGKSVAMVDGLLSLRDGVYYLDSHGFGKNNESEPDNFLWGTPDWQRVYEELSEIAKGNQIILTKNANRTLTMNIPALNVFIFITPTETIIKADNTNLRHMIRDVIVRNLPSYEKKPKVPIIKLTL
eukprot:TRINITY_DN11713_c0_g1_i1.p1 TRINITY_DN11713_c0_g1~~TRINITY_DN11713_c0_g1_i1.p1  ORF type:complete len:652 (+),score=107.52 TRINITY_DN11713_c0_g1_i1:30-1985(+)